MSMVSLRSVPVRKVLIYTLLVACLYGGADIVIRTLSLWKQQTYLPCTPDDEVSCTMHESDTLMHAVYAQRLAGRKRELFD